MMGTRSTKVGINYADGASSSSFRDSLRHLMEEGNGGGSADVGYDLNNDFERANGEGHSHKMSAQGGGPHRGTK